jgi:hypothetical protein
MLPINIGLQCVFISPTTFQTLLIRQQTYSPQNYTTEFGQMITAMANDPNISPRSRSLLIGPSISIVWTPEQVWDTGFIDLYSPNLAFLAVERCVS